MSRRGAKRLTFDPIAPETPTAFAPSCLPCWSALGTPNRGRANSATSSALILQMTMVAFTRTAAQGIRGALRRRLRDPVYFWTENEAFVTYDIDVVMAVSDRLRATLADLGFEMGRDGRHWRLAGTEIFLEAPSADLDADAVRRDKPRDPTEAEFLRSIGTPERLIGPTR